LPLKKANIACHRQRFDDGKGQLRTYILGIGPRRLEYLELWIEHEPTSFDRPSVSGDMLLYKFGIWAEPPQPHKDVRQSVPNSPSADDIGGEVDINREKMA
jgi:hypothetical protein